MAAPKKKAAATRRTGRTKNVSVSLDAEVLKILRARADSTHEGNLSAAIAEAAEVLHRQAAREAVLKELNRGRPPITDEERAAVKAELEEGWRHARKHLKKQRAA
jgi:hypothetical protein